MVGNIVFGSVLHRVVGYFSAFMVFDFVGCVHPSYVEVRRKTLYAVLHM
jgi:hypothetical protein